MNMNLTPSNERALKKLIRRKKEQSKKNWGVKVDLETRWGEVSDNDPRERDDGYERGELVDWEKESSADGD